MIKGSDGGGRGGRGGRGVGGRGGRGGGGASGGGADGQSKKLCQVFLRNLPLTMLEPVSGVETSNAAKASVAWCPVLFSKEKAECIGVSSFIQCSVLLFQLTARFELLVYMRVSVETLCRLRCLAVWLSSFRPCGPVGCLPAWCSVSVSQVPHRPGTAVHGHIR